MKVAIISKSQYIYSTQAMLDQLGKKGLATVVVNPAECNIFNTENKSRIFLNAESLENINYVIPRIGAASDYYGIYILQVMERSGIKSLNSSTSIIETRDKFNIYLKLLDNKLPVPETVPVKTNSGLDYIIEELGGFPVIVKLSRGSQGKGVMIAESMNSLKSIIDSFSLLNEEILIQEYIKTEPQNSDVRLYILDRSIIGATQRVNYNDFRSNTHCGGTMQIIEADNSLKDLALKAADCFKLNFCTVDFLINSNTPKILEVNSTPGLEKVETQAGLNLSLILASYIEEKLCQTNTRM